jgi:hypothetical protein
MLKVLTTKMMTTSPLYFLLVILAMTWIRSVPTVIDIRYEVNRTEVVVLLMTLETHHHTGISQPS